MFGLCCRCCCFLLIVVVVYDLGEGVGVTRLVVPPLSMLVLVVGVA